MRRRAPDETDCRYQKRVKLPDFCDYTSTVTADSFGASRLSELEALIRPHRPAIPTNRLAAFASGGRKTSDRHLRRRSNSYRPRRWHRKRFFPKRFDQDEEGRTTEDENKNSEAAKSRKARRRNRQLLRTPHEDWKSCVEYHEKDDTVTEPQHAVHWMPTHIWHAKRFRMERLFGWMVPMLHNNRGSAAALRLAREHRCLVYDGTWSKQPVWFRRTDALNHSSNLWSEQIRRLIPDFALSCREPVLECGEGMLHSLDAFPLDAVSPISWIVTRECLQERSEADTQPSLYVYFFTHPACHQNLYESLVKSLHDMGCDGPHRGITGGLQYHELRGGEAAYTSLRRCLPDATIPSRQSLVHGQIVQLQSNPPLLIRCVSPRETGKNGGNEGVCGVDVIVGCPATDAFFLSLVKVGGACAIGITESVALRLACEPPLQVFPREYPDTLHGQLYWKGGTAKVGVQQDWACIRWHYEGGVGRIREYDHRSLMAVDYGILMQNGEQTVGNPVVVRGKFLQPFEKASQGLMKSVSLPAGVSHRRPRRRKRRPVTTERTFVRPRIGTDAYVEAHQNSCNELLQQLTLPAFVVAHIQVESKGVFKAGAPLYRVSTAEQPMGFATSGEFCIVRGRFHGIALVNASSLLEALASGIKDEAVIFVRSSKNVQNVCLRARIQGKVDLHNVILGLS